MLGFQCRGLKRYDCKASTDENTDNLVLLATVTKNGSSISIIFVFVALLLL